MQLSFSIDYYYNLRLKNVTIAVLVFGQCLKISHRNETVVWGLFLSSICDMDDCKQKLDSQYQD